MRRLKTHVQLEDAMYFIDWTPEALRQTRKNFGLTIVDIAELMHVSKTTIVKIEKNEKPYKPLLILYGLVLERIYAYMNDYVPSFRKLGTGEQICFEEFMEYL